MYTACDVCKVPSPLTAPASGLFYVCLHTWAAERICARRA